MMEFSQSKILNQLPKQFFADLVSKVNAVKKAGVDVINLGQGNPDQPTFEYIVKAMQQAVTKPENHQYSLFDGEPSFKRAASEFYATHYHASFDFQKEIAVLGGSKTGLVELPFALCNPGDVILLPDPGYPDYLSGAALAGVTVKTFPLRAQNNFLPDLSEIDEAVAKKAKLMYLNYPNNPTGAVATKEFYAEVIAWAKKYHVGIVSDFAYGAIGFDGNKPISFMEVAGAREVGIEFYTFSKTFNMAGWRLAFAVGNETMIRALNLLQDHMYVSVFKAEQAAGKIALLADDYQSQTAALVARYQKRRDAFVTAAAKIGWQAFVPGGTFYAWLPTPKHMKSTEFADLLLTKAGVAVAPGVGFGTHGEGFVRVGLLMAPERLEEAVARVEKLKLF